MKPISHHIERVKAQPHHVRRSIAFSIAAGVSGLIAVVWLAASLSLGSFAIDGTDFAALAEQGGGVITTSSDTTGLAGAAEAVSSDDRSSAHLEIVVDSEPEPASEPERTILTF